MGGYRPGQAGKAAAVAALTQGGHAAPLQQHRGAADAGRQLIKDACEGRAAWGVGGGRGW